MAVSNYQDLIVWQKSMELAKSVYTVVNYLLKEEMSCFLRIVKGSAAELETQLLLCLNIGYLKTTGFGTFIEACELWLKKKKVLSCKLRTSN